MTTMKKVLTASVIFFLMLILMDTIVWNVLEMIRGLFYNSERATIFLIMQYLLSIGMVIFPPMMILIGKSSVGGCRI